LPTAERLRVTDALIERDLNRLMGMGCVKLWSLKRTPTDARRRRFTIVGPDGSNLSPRRGWEISDVYAFILGAMIGFEQGQRERMP
jgi:hypothetical protein